MQLLCAYLGIATLYFAVVKAQFQINTPASLVQCEPVIISWDGGQAPFFLAYVLSIMFGRINSGGVTGAVALQQYAGLTGSQFTWSANISAGTSIGFELTDSTGSIAQSAPVTIESGSSNSCLNGEPLNPPTTTSQQAKASTTTSDAAPVGPFTINGSLKIGTTSSRELSVNSAFTTIAADGSSSTSPHVSDSSGVGPSLSKTGSSPIITPTVSNSSISTSSVATSDASSPMSNSPAPSAGKSRLSTGTIVGIVVGSGAVAVLLAISSFLYGKNRAQVARAGLLTDASLLSEDRRDRSGRALGKEVETQANNIYPTGPTMVRRASSIRSSAQGHAEPLPDFHGEDVMTEKRLLELTRQRDRYRVVTPSRGRDRDGLEQLQTCAAPIVEEPISAGRGTGPRHEMDGGRRLAGGRPGEPVVDDFDYDTMSEGSTLLPPYSSHFGEL